MRVIPTWLIVLVVILIVLFLLNALHIVSIHGSVSAEIWPRGPHSRFVCDRSSVILVRPTMCFRG